MSLNKKLKILIYGKLNFEIFRLEKWGTTPLLLKIILLRHLATENPYRAVATLPPLDVDKRSKRNSILFK